MGVVRLLGKRLHGRGFVVLDVKDGIELCDLQQVVNFLRQVQKLEFPALIAHGGERADQLAYPGAVNVVHVAEVEKNALITLAKDVANRVTQDHATLAEGNAAAEIHNGDAIDLTRAALHGHWEASLPPAAGPWTCLISLISVPAWEGWISTSSMNERIKKMPRPEVLSRFSGASGSGMAFRSIPFPWSRIVITRSRPVRSKSSFTFLPGS